LKYDIRISRAVAGHPEGAAAARLAYFKT